MPSVFSYTFKLKRDSFTPMIVAPYVIKRNMHPKKGLLIDLYIPYPNPFFLFALKKQGLGSEFTLYSESVRQVVRQFHIPYRPLVCRHWPKMLFEDRMLIVTRYAVSDREVAFRGSRSNPPGNFKILEYGLFYVFDVYMQNLFFIMLVGFQRRLGLSFAKGSSYVWIPDLERISGMSAFEYKTMFDTDLFLRNIRVLDRLPKIEYRHRVDDWNKYRRLFWFRDIRPSL